MPNDKREVAVQSFEVVGLGEGPDLAPEADRLAAECWPAFLLHGDTPHWGSLFEQFADFQFFLCGPDSAVLAAGHTVPFFWNGTMENLPSTMGELMERAIRTHRLGHPPNTLSALAALVSPPYRGRGLSREILKVMKALAAGRGFRSLVAPVRPTLKSSYPLVPIDRYARWTREDGMPFDPWIRVHRRLGAEIAKVAPATVTVEGTAAQWEEWTGMSFPETGEYVVPGALCPVCIDSEEDSGHYEDPNVWMVHSV